VFAWLVFDTKICAVAFKKQLGTALSRFGAFEAIPIRKSLQQLLPFGKPNFTCSSKQVLHCGEL
jgi:hypothetical protein